MRIRLLLSLAALAPMAMMAETLTPEAALQRALGDTPMRKVSTTTSKPELLYTQIEAKSATPAAYVYSRGEEGFMIVSADDVAVPVLGYSDEGTFDADNIPDNMRAWLGFYADEIAWARNNDAAIYAPQKASRADRSAIAPLVKTKWGQDAPYNNMCPKIGTRNTVTGCVATAMSQIMNYHKWPQSAGSGTKSVSVGGVSYTMDFSKTVFDWANMLDNYSATAGNQTQQDAVALLMKACGFSVDMNYTTSASGAVQAKVAGALINNFGYDKGIVNVVRDCYTIAEWNDLIYAQLAKKQPVQYGGQSSAGGHSFVCDGYSANNYFHINWGWDGMSDGYFLLSALDPESQGTGGSGNGSGFDSDQDAVINICKPCGTAEVVPGLYASAMSIASKSTGFNSSLSASLTHLSNNSAVSPLDAMLGIAFVNKSTGRRVICSGSSTISGLTTGSYYSSAVSVNVSTRSSSEMPAGEYDIVPVFSQGIGSSATYVWRDIPLYAGSNRYTATVTSSGITINTLSASIATTSIAPETLYQGVASKITVTVQNSGDVPYVGTIKARVRKGNTTTLACNGQNMNIEVPAKSSATFDYYITVPKSTAAGTYNIVFLDGSNKVITSRAQTATVATPPTLELSFSNLRVAGSSTEVDPANVNFEMTLSCTSFQYDGTFKLYFFPYVTGQSVSSIGMINSQPVSITAGETKTVSFTGDASSFLENGKKYFCCARYNEEWVTDNCVFTTSAESGIEDITTDAEAVSEVYYNLMGVAVNGTPSAGHYIKVTTYADGTRKAEHAIVK